MTDERYLRLLSREYPNAQAAASEIINLKAIMSLELSRQIGELSALLNAYRGGAIKEK